MNCLISKYFPEAPYIVSRSNPLIISLSKLSQLKYRRESALFLAEGIKLTEEAVGLPDLQYILIRSDDGMADESILRVAALCRDPSCIRILSSSAFEKISTENSPQGIIAVIRFMRGIHVELADETESSFLLETAGKRMLAIDSVQDPGNLGTIIRTACAFGYQQILLGNCADIYNPKTVRASMGMLFRTRIAVCASLSSMLSNLHHVGHRIISTALHENSLVLGKDILLPTDCIVIGNEGHGVSQGILNLSDATIRIPMEVTAESLNAAGAAAICMWEYYKTFDK